MNKSSEEKLLCTKCITAKPFAKWIRQNGQRGQCDFDAEHGNRGSVLTVEAFAVHVDEFFREHYQLGREEPYTTEDSDNVHYRQRGSSLLEILNDELCSNDDEVVEAIIENLPDISHHDISQGADAFNDDTASYESIADVEAQERADQEEYWYERRFVYQWEDFCQKVQYERRFFKIKELLDQLFGQPTEYEGGPINPVYVLKAGRKIFRARILDDGFTEEILARDPDKQLGAPPRDRAQAGRMNVEYIPAFYGLADAIILAMKAAHAAEDQHAAIERAAKLVEAAEERLTAAVSTPADARETHTKQMANAIRTSSAVAAPSALRAARLAEADVLDEVESARAALVELEAELPDLEAAKTVADNDVTVAINTIMAAAGVELLAEAERLRETLLSKWEVLSFIADRQPYLLRRRDEAYSFADMKQAERLVAPLNEISSSVWRVLEIGVRYVGDDTHPALDGWKQARLALRSNPDAPLPIQQCDDPRGT
jgi:hypothetical protein